jgi:hypothetical protein
LATISPASTAELDVEIGSDFVAEWAPRSEVDDAAESFLPDDEGRDWDCAGRLAGWARVAEEGSEDSACRP